MAGAVTVATSDPSTTGGVSSITSSASTVTETSSSPVLSCPSVASTTIRYSPTSDGSLNVTIPPKDISKRPASAPERVQVTPSSEV